MRVNKCRGSLLSQSARRNSLQGGIDTCER
jgi:hypothetical protein